MQLKRKAKLGFLYTLTYFSLGFFFGLTIGRLLLILVFSYSEDKPEVRVILLNPVVYFR